MLELSDTGTIIFMKLPGNKALFAISILAGTLAIVGMAAYSRLDTAKSAAPADEKKMAPATHHLHGQIQVTEQITPESIAALKQQGIQNIIAMRPDGEAPNQASAATIEKNALAAGMKFTYIPIPHGDIPDASVTALQQALEKNQGPVLLYCRSGSRAARTWSLVEASRAGGMDAATIMSAVKSAGLKADDLEGLIQKRIAARGEGGKS